MEPNLAEQIVLIAGMYIGIGAGVGLFYVTLLLKRSSAGARTAAPLQFRILIFPASVVLWPYVLILGLLGGSRRGARYETSA
jgi:hypothetical protein